MVWLSGFRSSVGIKSRGLIVLSTAPWVFRMLPLSLGPGRSTGSGHRWDVPS